MTWFSCEVTRSDRLGLSVMPEQHDIAGKLAKPHEESRDSVQRSIFDFDSIINGLIHGQKFPLFAYPLGRISHALLPTVRRSLPYTHETKLPGANGDRENSKDSRQKATYRLILRQKSTHEKIIFRFGTLPSC